jgi:hypothetical protein
LSLIGVSSLAGAEEKADGPDATGIRIIWNGRMLITIRPQEIWLPV